MIKYVVSPSGTRTDLFRELERPSVIVIDLNKILRQKDNDLFKNDGERWERFWRETEQLVLEVEQEYSYSPKNTYLVILGAGALQSDKTLEFLSEPQRRKSIIFIDQDPSSCLTGHWEGKSLKSYLASERSRKRMEIYKLGKRYCLDSILKSRKDVLDRTKSILKKSLGLK